ncbi:SusC/RagA family TonB-linked outer membrane protein [Mucilaginibacter gynuensis]|uniref:SusC/RagA family TonB-linked outer membrane protein n=1 Tax=Mucilaginibacter gynuensis TaxID=1302236 RepID=A0ABP8GKX1_9SPHI
MKYYIIAILLLTGRYCFSQEAGKYTVNGKVLDAGQALPGASVTITGTSYRTVTGNSGQFTFNLPAGSYVLKVAYVGYNTIEQRITVPLRDSLVISLQVAAAELEGMVVSTGYQQIPRERVTGSFVQVDRNLVNRSVSTDIVDRLRDVVPGLSFNSVGTRISVRGQSTIKSNADPLIVVDGFPYNEPIENLNPNDVESISILKDAAAASIWGAKAGNGVIVITTRRGLNNKPMQISLNTNVTVGKRPDLYYRPRMSTSDYIDIEKRLFGEDYYTGLENAGNHPPLSPVVELLIDARDGKISQSEADRQIDALRGQDIRQDVSHYLYRPAVKQQYALSLDGGSLNQRYYYSLGYDRNLDNLQGNGFNRLTLNGNNTWTMLDRKLEFSLGLNLVHTLTDQNNPGSLLWNRGQNIYPYAALADQNGNALALTRDHRLGFIDEAAGQGLLDWRYRPLDELRLADNRNRLNSQRINAALKYRLPLGLQAQVLYQYDRSQLAGRNLQSAESYAARDMINRFTQVNADDGTLVRPVPLGGLLDLSNSTTISHDGRAQLSYDGNLGAKHSLNALAGYEIRTQNVLADAYRLYGYDAEHATSLPVDGRSLFPRFDDPFQENAIPLNMDETDLTDRYRSWYANAAYTYDGRLTLSASARIDQSNLFGVKTNQKGVPLWSAGAAWQLSRESFYHIGWLPELKLRATYGFNGNSNKSLSAYTTALYYDGSDSQIQQPYADILNPPNPLLRWEKIRHINLGLDFAALAHRVSGTLEFYLKRGTDLIGRTSYPPSSGVSVFTGNTAQTSGHGFDLDLQTRNLAGVFSWTSNVIVSHIAEKVTQYEQASLPQDYVFGGASGSYPLAGKPLFAVYSYASAGLDPETGDPRGYLNGEVSKDYTAMSVAATPENLVYHGSSRPTWFGAFRNTISYKSWTLSANISYRFGYYFRRPSIRYSNNYGLAGQHGDYALRWQKPGDETHTVVPSIPAAASSARDDFYTYSSALVEKGDHIRLQDLTASYTFAQGKFTFLPKCSLQVYIYAANLGILWRANKNHIDPDFLQTYPAPRTIAGGIRLNF